MRFPEISENLVGKVCVGSTGRVGVVSSFGDFNPSDVGRENETAIPAWLGFGLDGLGCWASTKPVIIAEDLEEFRQKIKDRFDGKFGR